MTEQDSSLSLVDYLALLRQGFLISTLFALVGLFAAIVVTNRKEPVYETYVELVIGKQQAALLVPQELSPVRAWDTTFLETQIRVIKSDYLVARAIEILRSRLACDETAAAARDAAKPAHSSGTAPASRAIGGERIDDPRLCQFVKSHSATELAERLIDGLTVGAIANTRIITIRTRSPQPAFAAAAANCLAEAYTEYIAKTYSSSAETMFLALQKQADEAAKNIKSSSIALLSFKKRSELDSMTGGESGGGTQDMGHVESIKEQLALADPDISALRDDRVRLGQEIATLSKRYKPKHPEMQALLTKRDFLDAKIRQMQDGLYVQWNRKHMEEQSSVEYAILEQDLEATRRWHDLLASKLKEFDFSKDTPDASVQILKRAVVPQAPAYPKKAMNLALGTVSGLMLGMLIAFMQAQSRASLVTLGIAARDLPAPLIGHLPHVSTEELSAILLGQAKTASPAAEAFKTLRTVIETLLRKAATEGAGEATSRLPVVLITSPERSDGKSTISLALARSFASLNRRVLLVDVDLRRGRLNETLHIDTQEGLSELLGGNNAVKPVDIGGNLSFLQRGGATHNPSELLAAKGTEDIIVRFAREFDVVILDSPPILPVTDAAIIARHAAVRLLVARSERTHIAACRQGATILRNLGSTIHGVILNDVKASPSRYYGSYQRGYY
jgi:tyrosine-protein kinase Etk/Wzc